MTKLKIALFIDHTTSNHFVETLLAIDSIHIIGYGGVERDLNDLKFYEEAGALIEASDAVVMSVIPSQQFELAKFCLKNLKHLYIEKPYTSNIDEAESLLSMQREAAVLVQLGAGLRLNAAYMAANLAQFKPQYIEATHLKMNAGHQSVVLDLLIQDIDLVLQLTKSEVRRISANAVCIANDTPDLVNVRIEFGNGSVANLTANRLADKNEHHLGAFQKNAFSTIDFLAPDTSAVPESAYKIALPSKSEPGFDLLTENEIAIHRQNLVSFFKSIETNQTPIVTLQDGYRALKLAYQIIDQIEERGLEN